MAHVYFLLDPIQFCFFPNLFKSNQNLIITIIMIFIWMNGMNNNKRSRYMPANTWYVALKLMPNNHFLLCWKFWKAPRWHKSFNQFKSIILQFQLQFMTLIVLGKAIHQTPHTLSTAKQKNSYQTLFLFLLSFSLSFFFSFSSLD